MMKQKIRRSGLKIMSSLIVLLGSLSYIMILAVINGSLGFICAMGVTVVGAIGVAKILGEAICLSYTLIIILLVLFGVLRGILRYFEQYSNHYIAFKLLAVLRDKIFAKLRKLAPQELDNDKKGSIIALITSDIETLEVFYAHTISPICIFSLDSTRLYDIIDDSLIDETKSGLIVKLSEEDYKKVFETPITSSNQSALYFENDKLAMKYLDNLPTGVMGMLSNSKVYVNNAGEIYEMNIIYYISLIVICILLAALISVIFSRSVKVFQTDYAVYRTLGISNKISSGSLHVQMTLIFLPTIVLLPLISLITVLIPNLNIGFITIGDYLFIEIMLLLIVQFVAFNFNKSINSQSIRKTLRRGIKG